MNKAFDADMAKIIANPHLMSNVPSRQMDEKFTDKLRKIIQSEYRNIYLNEKFINDVTRFIGDKIKDVCMENEIIECVNSLVERCIAENTFGFFIQRRFL